MSRPTEKQLDAALEESFKSDPDFTRWFLSKTKFSGIPATYFWSRSDHPWGTIDYTITNPETGTEETSRKECETDVLVVFETEQGDRIALHIENKIGTGKFTALQPELYRPRAEQWKNNPKYQNYTDFDTVLVAPKQFQERNEAQAALFGSFIAHEEIAEFISAFQSYSCPICGVSLNPNPRYKKYVCHECASKAVAPDGRPLSFSNIGLSGGYIATYAGTDIEYQSHECLIDNVRCLADEARFGGIVIEVDDRR